MPWNGPIDGDWSKCDFTKGPFAGGVMELTHDEVLFVQETAAPIAVGHEQDDFYIISQYNIAVNYEKAVNGDTWAVIKQYDPAVNTMGINENGVVMPEETQPEEVVEGV